MPVSVFLLLVSFVDERYGASVFDHLRHDLHLYAIENLERVTINGCHLLLRLVGYLDSGVSPREYEETFESVLLNHHVCTTLSDFHDNSNLVTVCFIALANCLKIQVSVKGDGGLACHLGHAVLAIHLVTLL